KQCKAGQIKTDEVKAAQHLLKCVTATLQNVSIINPFATLINLPDDIAYPRKSLLLLLNFIEVITYFFQYQRTQTVDESTGEVLIKTHPNDIELAFKFLRNNLFRRADELTTSVRGFYNWLVKFLTEAQTTQFTALDIRKAKPINPRTLNRYLQELKLFGYIQVAGGNKHREGFIYKLTGFGNQTDIQSRIGQDIQATLKSVREAYRKEQRKEQPPQGQEPLTEQPEEPTQEPQQQATQEQKDPIRQAPEEPQKQGANYTYQKMLEAAEAEPNKTFSVHQVYALT